MKDPFADWPPIIANARRGRWVGLRDSVLTLLMWVLLLSILATEIRFAWDSLMVLLGRSDAVIDAELALFWQRMQPLLWLMGALVAMLAAATIVSRRRRDEALVGKQPEPLADTAIARLAGIPKAGLEEARSHRIAVVERRPDGSLSVTEKAGRKPL